MSLTYVMQRTTDALAVLRDIAAAPITLEVDGCKEINLYGIPVLITKERSFNATESDYITVMWPNRKGGLNHCEGLHEFLTFVLKRYW